MRSITTPSSEGAGGALEPDADCKANSAVSSFDQLVVLAAADSLQLARAAIVRLGHDLPGLVVGGLELTAIEMDREVVPGVEHCQPHWRNIRGKKVVLLNRLKERLMRLDLVRAMPAPRGPVGRGLASSQCNKGSVECRIELILPTLRHAPKRK